MKKRYFLISALLLMIIYIAINAVQICTYSKIDETQKADAAIILGAGTANGEVTPVFRERINHGIELYNEGYVQKLIFTGGYGKGNSESDSHIAKRYAIILGIPDNDILIEEKSTITQQNFEYAKQLMSENALKDAIIVSDPLHMKRAMLLAKDYNITAYSSPTPTTMYKSIKTTLPFLVRETVFYILYKGYRILHFFNIITL